MRGIRTKQLDYENWTGISRDHLRERLLMLDIEKELLDSAVISATGPQHLRRIASVVAPWTSSETYEEESMEDIIEDLEELYASLPSREENK